MRFEFPKGFLWGAATSAHQVEGGNQNNWSEWEKKNAERLSRESGEKYPPENYISGRACDHYNRYKEDFALAKNLGHNATRFSIEWSRVEPEEGKFDEAAITHYRDVIKTCRGLGLEPFVTLWHWTLPLWLSVKGGVLTKNFGFYFSRYAEKMAREFPEVSFWITLNEPEIYSTNSYLKGAWTPQKKNLFSYLRVLDNLANAHKLVYDAIKKINPETKIGIAKNNVYFESSGGFINDLLKKTADWNWNDGFLKRMASYQDFIGLNHYFHNQINYGFGKNKNKKTSDMGWELYPEGIYRCLVDLKKYGKPVYITENGLADAKDEKREWFIKESLKNVYRAISEGVDVRGYLHWSLLDNFEWDKGFWPRFGLVEINYETFGRKIRPSAYSYKKICETNSLEE